MTKLDETFVAAAKEKHPEAAYYIDTLAEEVRRLELLGGQYEQALADRDYWPPHCSVKAIVAALMDVRDIASAHISTGPKTTEELTPIDRIHLAASLALNGSSSMTIPANLGEQAEPCFQRIENDTRNGCYSRSSEGCELVGGKCVHCGRTSEEVARSRRTLRSAQERKDE